MFIGPCTFFSKFGQVVGGTYRSHEITEIWYHGGREQPYVLVTLSDLSGFRAQSEPLSSREAIRLIAEGIYFSGGTLEVVEEDADMDWWVESINGAIDRLKADEDLREDLQAAL